MPTDPTDKPRRAPLTARHTLGSDPEAIGTPRGAPEPSGRESSPAELVRPVWWVVAQQLTEANDGDKARKQLAERVIAQVEQMWAAVDEVERVARTVGVQEKTPLIHFRDFLRNEVVGVFADLARHVSLVVVGADGWRMVQFDESAERFGRYLDLARFAASDASIPPTVQTVVQRANLTLSDALPDLAALVGALAVMRAQDGARFPPLVDVS